MQKEKYKENRTKSSNEKGIYQLFGKRLFDILITLPALVILSPIFLLIAIMIRLDSNGPVIYKQGRVGKGVRDFYVYKFRTMVLNADKIGSTSTVEGDKRITKIGGTLRKLSLDELPQLINVLKGDMSLVGYRPGVRADYSLEDLESKIFSVRPGITGYAQVNGRSSLTVKEKRYWENKYAEEKSFLTDIGILIKTVGQVLRRSGVN